MTILKESAREVDFDLSARAEYRIPERMERTVYISPLAANVTPQMVKVSISIVILRQWINDSICTKFNVQKMFYQGKCGAIKSVKIERHKKKKTSFAKSMYALVEFAHRDSVEVCTCRCLKANACYDICVHVVGCGSDEEERGTCWLWHQPPHLKSWALYWCGSSCSC